VRIGDLRVEHKAAAAAAAAAACVPELQHGCGAAGGARVGAHVHGRERGAVAGERRVRHVRRGRRAVQAAELGRVALGQRHRVARRHLPRRARARSSALPGVAK
jgi:hypothetical protein